MNRLPQKCWRGSTLSPSEGERAGVRGLLLRRDRPFQFRSRKPRLANPLSVALLLAIPFLVPPQLQAAPVRGWLNWRGPQQNGSSLEKSLPDKIDVKEALWVADFPGQSTPVIANGKLYTMGYLGNGPDLQE